jgi:hypothetical protein
VVFTPGADGAVTLTSTDGSPLAGALSVDAAAGQLVFTAADGTTTSTPLAGVTAVSVGRGAVTTDLSGAPAGVTISVATADGDVVALSPGRITITGLGADLLLTAAGRELVLQGLTALAALRFTVPDVSLVLDAGTGRLTVTGQLSSLGADVALAGRSVTVTPGSVLDLTGSSAAGDLAITASHVSTTDAAASVSLTGAVVRAGDVLLSATSSADGGHVEGASASHTGRSSASTTVVDTAITATGDVTVLADSTARGSVSAAGAGAGSTATDAAVARLALDSSALARVGGTSSVVAGGDLVVRAVDTVDGSATADARAAAAGGAVAEATGSRTTRAVVDAESLTGIAVAGLAVLAESRGELLTTSTGSAGGATANATAPLVLTGGLAQTLSGPVPAAAALGLTRVAGVTEALLGHASSAVVPLAARRSALVRAVTTARTGVVADSSATDLGAAAAIALSALTTRASLAGSLTVTTPRLDVEALLPSAATTARALGGGQPGLAVAGSRLETVATGLPGARFDVDGADVDVRAASAAATAADASGSAPGLAVAVVDDRTTSGLGDGVTLLGARDLSVQATSADSADSAAAAGSAVTLATVLTSAGLGSGPALALSGALRVRADQDARATSRGDAVAVTSARHQVTATTGRPVDAAGPDQRRRRRLLARAGRRRHRLGQPARRAPHRRRAGTCGRRAARGLAPAAPSGRGRDGRGLPGRRDRRGRRRGPSRAARRPAGPLRRSARGPRQQHPVRRRDRRWRARHRWRPRRSQPDLDARRRRRRGPGSRSDGDRRRPHRPRQPRATSRRRLHPQQHRRRRRHRLPHRALVHRPRRRRHDRSPLDRPHHRPRRVRPAGRSGPRLRRHRRHPHGRQRDARVRPRRPPGGRLGRHGGPRLRCLDRRRAARPRRRHRRRDLHLRRRPGADDRVGRAERPLVPRSRRLGRADRQHVVGGRPARGAAALQRLQLRAAVRPARPGAAAPAAVRRGRAVRTADRRAGQPRPRGPAARRGPDPAVLRARRRGRRAAGPAPSRSAAGCRSRSRSGAQRLLLTAALSTTYRIAGAVDGGSWDDLVLTGVALDLAGALRVSAATATLSQASGALRIQAASVSASAGLPSGPGLSLSADAFEISVADGASATDPKVVTLSVTGGTAALTGLPGVELSGGGWSIDHAAGTWSATTAATQTLRLAGATATLTGLTVSRSGDSLTLTVPGGSLALTAGSQAVTVTVTGGTLSVDPTGVAGALAGTVSVGDGPLTLTGAVSVQVNSRPAAVGSLPAGPYLRFSAATAAVALSGLGSLSGSMSFERQTLADGSVVTVVGLSGITARTAANVELLTGGSGVLVLTSAGAAGTLTGTLSIADSGFSAGATAVLRFNSTGTPVRRTVVLDGRELAVDVPQPSLFQVQLLDAQLVLGDVVVRGSFTFSAGATDTVFGGTGLTVFIGSGPAWLADGTLNPLARGLLVTGATVGIVERGTEHALDATGTVQLVGLPGVTLTGSLRVRASTIAGVVDETIRVGAGSVTVSSSARGNSATGTLTLGVLGTSLTGGFSLHRGERCSQRDGRAPRAGAGHGWRAGPDRQRRQRLPHHQPGRRRPRPGRDRRARRAWAVPRRERPRAAGQHHRRRGRQRAGRPDGLRQRHHAHRRWRRHQRPRPLVLPHRRRRCRHDDGNGVRRDDRPRSARPHPRRRHPRADPHRRRGPAHRDGRRRARRVHAQRLARGRGEHGRGPRSPACRPARTCG